MSVTSAAAAPPSATTQTDAKHMFDPTKPMFLPVYGVVEAAQERLAAKLDTNQDGGVDLQELNALGGLGSGKNGPAAFAALDSDGDGKLNLRELQRSAVFSPDVLNTLLGQQAGNGLSEWLVSEGDADGDGALSLDEFRTVGPKGELARIALNDSTPTTSLNRTERTFAAADSDGDGRVTATELIGVSQNYIRRLWPGQNPNALATTLMTRDQDGSGGLSKTELARADADAIFETADADTNGEITLAELQAEIARLPDFYARGAIKIAGPAPGPLDPSDLHARTKAPAERIARPSFELPSAGQAGLLQLFREEILRLTQAMVDEVAKPTDRTVA